MPRFDSRDWCAVSRGTSLLLVGDSMTVQVYHAIVRLLQRGGLHPERMSGVAGLCDSRPDEHPFHEGCDAVQLARECGGASMAYVRSDLAWLNASRREYHGGKLNSIMHPVHGLFAALRPTHVVINRGAHFTGDADYAEGLRSALSIARALLPSAHVMLRSTASGHRECANHTQPLASLPPDAGARLLPHNWSDFPRQNRLMRTIARERDDPALYLDFAAPARYRPDHHYSAADCLHYESGTLDSVPSFWARFTYAAIWLTAITIAA